MRTLLLLFLLLGTLLEAKPLSMATLRLEERSLTLAEFKTLHKQRQSIQHNIRQTLKHTRLKHLNKKRLSAMQNSRSATELLFMRQSTYMRDLKENYVTDTPPETQEGSNTSTTPDLSGGVDAGIAPPTSNNPDPANEGVRNGTANPWARQ